MNVKNLLNSQPESPLTRGNPFAQRASARSWLPRPAGNSEILFSHNRFRENYYLLNYLKGLFFSTELILQWKPGVEKALTWVTKKAKEQSEESCG